MSHKNAGFSPVGCSLTNDSVSLFDCQLLQFYHRIEETGVLGENLRFLGKSDWKSALIPNATEAPRECFQRIKMLSSLL